MGSLLLGCGFGGWRKGKRQLFLWAFTHVCSLQAKSRRTTKGDTWESRSAKTGSKHLSGKVRGTARQEGRRHGSTRSRRGLRPGAGGARVCPGETEAPPPVADTGRRAVGAPLVLWCLPFVPALPVRVHPGRVLVLPAGWPAYQGAEARASPRARTRSGGWWLGPSDVCFALSLSAPAGLCPTTPNRNW